MYTPEEKQMQNTKISLMIVFVVIFFVFGSFILSDLDQIVKNTNICAQKDCVCYEKIDTIK